MSRILSKVGPFYGNWWYYEFIDFLATFTDSILIKYLVMLTSQMKFGQIFARKID